MVNYRRDLSLGSALVPDGHPRGGRIAAGGAWLLFGATAGGIVFGVVVVLFVVLGAGPRLDRLGGPDALKKRE